MGELAPQNELNKPRDHESIIMVPPTTWTCILCEPEDREGAGTTVEWTGPGNDGPDGRCRNCGQKYGLGTYNDPRCYPALDGHKDDPVAHYPYKHRWWAETGHATTP